ncbi:MAG: helix-turn-helix transcriptional regulator [Gammaproteobacteria bacterium]|nr:helix-turn-helix transcriptional regulator [Gammaproteobacteria bacterium]
MNFGDKLKQLRNQTNWTQPQAAEAIGIEQSYLSKLENDRSQPSSEIFTQILNAYQINVASLLSDLSSRACAQLRAIPQVAEHMAQLDSFNLMTYRRWLLAGLAAMGLGALLLAAGWKAIIPDDTVYEYHSWGVVKPGERPDIFSQYRQFIMTLPEEEYRALQNDVMQRVNEARRFEPTYRGQSFHAEVTGGMRNFKLAETLVTPSFGNALLIVFGAMLLALALGCFYLARTWR